MSEQRQVRIEPGGRVLWSCSCGFVGYESPCWRCSQRVASASQPEAARAGYRLSLSAAEHLAALGPAVTNRGTVSESLVGRRIGPFIVQAYHSPGGCSPWWICECQACKVVQAVRGNKLRNPTKSGSVPACRDCGARS